MKKRNKFISFFTALFVGLSCLFTACNSKTNFSLRFMVDDTVYATVSTAGNEVIQMPKNPVKEDYIFEGWYWDNDVWRNQFTARSLLDTPLSSNMEVYAHFVDESYLKGTDINIKTADKVNIEGIGDVFYLRVRNNQLVCKFNDYVEINPHSTWTLSTDIASNNTIASKTVELSVGDNPLYYIYVTDKDNFHETYIVLVHRNYMFTVSFNSNGGSACSSQQVEEGYYLENIPTTTRKGYIFDRWNYDFKNEPIKSNVTAKAIWTANNYKITYNPNGGSVSSETQTVTFDERYTLATPTRLGYSFKGWKTSSGSYFANSGTWTLDQNITLTADWEIIYYSLTYELNGGSSSSIVLKSSYTVEDAFTIPSPSRTGYTFKGWSLSSSLTNAKIDYSVEKGTTGNLKFYAKWEANTYTVTYDVNGGDALDENTQTVTYGENTTLANPTREGYDFAGWYNGSSKVSDGDWNIANEVTLTVRWEATEYAIKYNLNGGTNSSNNPLKYTIESETIVLEDATREGYTFKGWTTDEIVEPTFGLSVPHGSTGEKQFTANWDANTYTVTYDVNGGNAIEDNVKEYVFDSDVTLLTPTRPGYNFAGWYYGTQLVDSGIWKIADNVTLVARWSREEFNIQYQLNNGNNDPSNPTSYNYDSETITLADATRVGYTFLGWTSSEIQTPTKGVQIVHNSIGDKLFIANWQANTYTVTYDVNGGNSIGKISEEIVFDEVLTLINPTRTGYTFSGWYSGNTLYESGVWKTAKDVTLVARWTPNTYTITKENGSGAGSSTVTYDDNYNLGTSSKDGYDFVGWYTEMYGQGTQYTDASGNSLNPYTDANDQTLYASFVYHITFVSNGGSYVPALTLHENECLSDTIVSEKENRTFGGWFTDPELTQPVSYSKLLGNITLYAKWEEEVQPTQLTYAYVSTTKLTIQGMSYTGTSVILPSHIGGEPVEAIASQALKNMNFTSLEIPETISSIGHGAFQGCNSLNNLTIPFVGSSANKSGTYDSVFGYIFGSSTSSQSGWTKQYYDGVDNNYRYYNIPSSLRNVTVTSQTSFGKGIFYGCNNLATIAIPDETNKLGDGAFYGCTSLKRLNSSNDGLFNVPNSLYIISSYCFFNCPCATKVVLSPYTSDIGNYAFADCVNVKQFNSSTDRHLVVPSSCQSVGSYAFRGMNLMTDVIIPESVTYIGEGALSNCNSLVNLTIPFVGSSANKSGTYDSVFGYIFGSSTRSQTGWTKQYYDGVDNNARYYNIPSTLKNVTVTVQTSFGKCAFYGCSNLVDIKIPTNTKTIGEAAFYGCTSLKRLNSEEDGVFNIPTGVTNISAYAFYNCQGATKINLSNSVTTIGNYAFADCSNVKQFNSSTDGHLLVPSSCQSVGSYAFRNMNLMTDVVIPESVTYIGEGALYGFKSLENLTIPFVGSSANKSGTYDSVFGYIFGSSTSSQSGWTKQYYDGVDNNARYYNIPSTLKNVTVTVQTSFGKCAFYGCDMLEKILILHYQEFLRIEEGTFYNCSNLLYLNSDEEGKFIISDNTNYIGNHAFCGCSNISKINSDNPFTINLPSSCTYVGSYAFYRLVLIKTAYFPESVTYIGEGALSNCNSLVNLTIPFVGSSANKSGTYDSVFGYIFGSSTRLQTGWTKQYYDGVDNNARYYNIPSTLKNVTVTVQTSFGKCAFYGCSNLVDIKIPTNTKTIGEAAFYGCTSLKRLNSEEDGVFNIPTGVTNISAYAFYNCQGATKINLSNSVTTIGNYAFADCSNVKQFNSSTDGHLLVPSSCQSVGSYAFRNMNLMTDVVIPESVTYIGEGALSNCNSLVNLTIPFVGSSANKSGTYDSVFGYIFGSSTRSQTGWTKQYYDGVDNNSRYYNIPSTLKNVTVTVQTSFGKCAFYGCGNLTDIYLLKDSDTSANGCLTNCNAEVHKVLDESPTAPWNGTTIATGFSSGSGTENDPYIINSAAELAYLAQEVNNGNSFAGVYFVLGNDINLNGHTIIIGDSALHPFKGTINGNGHVIRNLTINSTDTYAGLFGYFSGTIYNVGFESVSIKTNSTEESVYAGIFGYVSSSGIIHDVYATGSITATGQTYVYAGGLVGYCEGTIYNSYSRCNVTCTSSGYMAFAGGLVGYLNSGTLSNSFATGNVSAKGATTNYSRNGGLVGTNNGGTIENCYKSSSQTLTRNGTSGSAYNEEGTTVSFENVTGDMIIEGLGWGSNIWDGSEDFPLF